MTYFALALGYCTVKIVERGKAFFFTDNLSFFLVFKFEMLCIFYQQFNRAGHFIFAGGLGYRFDKKRKNTQWVWLTFTSINQSQQLARKTLYLPPQNKKSTSRQVKLGCTSQVLNSKFSRKRYTADTSIKITRLFP